GVVEMQMRVDHPSDVGGTVPHCGQGILQLRGAPAGRALILDTVDVHELRVFLVAEAGVDEDETVVVLDEEAPQREGDAIALVGGNAALAEPLWHDAETG